MPGYVQASEQSEKGKKPNIVYVMIDGVREDKHERQMQDMWMWQSCCFGGNHIQFECSFRSGAWRTGGFAR